MRRIAIVAAMEREVAPLIRNWQARTIERGGQSYRIFEKGNAVAICGGMGVAAARRATEAIIDECQPSLVLSAGFAGALDPALRVGEILEPNLVINGRDGVRTETGRGQGTLVTFDAVAGRDQKKKLRSAYAAAAVDMEAAAVAQGAAVRGVRFGALKAVSDEAGFEMPLLESFVRDGSFRTGRYALHVAVRPRLWSTTVALARNSAKASKALSVALEQYLDRTS